MSKNNVLVICGPTATGKTDLALKMATLYGGEIVSADSRQIYKQMDIITGKDVPAGSKFSESKIIWKGRHLGYYQLNNSKLWLVDIVFPNEKFNLSYWNECATLVINDILSRGKLPIVTGVTGLYIKSIQESLVDIHVPIDENIRLVSSSKTTSELFDYLLDINPNRATSMNESDKNNPRRLIRAIEVSRYSKNEKNLSQVFDTLDIGLFADNQYMYKRIDARVDKRMANGAEDEVKKLLSYGYTWDLPSMKTSGYYVWKDYFDGVNDLSAAVQKWKWREHRDYRKQLTWFRKRPQTHWFNITTNDWESEAEKLVSEWYNNH